jgi:hypothetical protein
MWKNKYEALAKLYSQLRQEHLDLLGKYKTLQLQANNAKEATEKLDSLQAEMRAKNMELADLIRERDRAKNELTRMQGVSTITVVICVKIWFDWPFLIICIAYIDRANRKSSNVCAANCVIQMLE